MNTAGSYLEAGREVSSCPSVSREGTLSKSRFLLQLAELLMSLLNKSSFNETISKELSRDLKN